MMDYMPFSIMYKYTNIDSDHKMYMPRFGYSNKQITSAENRAKKLHEALFGSGE